MTRKTTWPIDVRYAKMRSMSSEAPTNRQPVRPSILAAIVVAAAIAAFVSSISDTWIYDDHALIEGNAYIHSFSWWKHWFTTDFWDVNEELKRFGSRMVYWRPLVTLSYAVDWAIGHGSPAWLHVSNLLMHATASLLVFRALRRWVGDPVAACLGAVLWAVHPTKAEAVAWISGRTDVMCMVGMMLALEGVALRSSGRKGAGIAIEVLGVAIGVMSKEQVIVLPALVAVEVWALSGKPAVSWQNFKKPIVAALPYLGFAIAYLAVRSRYLPMKSSRVFGVPASLVVGWTLETYGRFSALTVWPHPLSIQQGLVTSVDGHVHASMGYAVVGAIVLSAMAVACVMFRSKAPLITVGFLLWVGLLLPTSNIVPTSMKTLMAERFLYVPMLGISLVVAAVVARAEAQRAAIVGAFSAASLALIGLSFQRSSDYQAEQKFWAHELRLHPNSLEAIGFYQGRAAITRDYPRALALLAEMHRAAITDYSHTEVPATQVLEAVRLVLLLAPDHDVKTLRAVDEFCTVATERTKKVAELSAGGVVLSLPLDGKNLYAARKLYPRLMMARASIESRLGDDKSALAHADAAMNACPGCETVGMEYALVRARAGDFAGAQSMLDTVQAQRGIDVGLLRTMFRDAESWHHAASDPAAPEPQRIIARASELARLEAWGRAYDYLAPHRADFRNVPSVALTFAELAYRAGENSVAQEVLTGLGLPPAEIDARKLAWAQKMGWR